MNPTFQVLKQLERQRLAVFKNHTASELLFFPGITGEIKREAFLKELHELRKAGYLKAVRAKAGPGHYHKTYTRYQITDQGKALLKSLKSLKSEPIG